MKRACVIGWPIAHSRSPLIHGYWLDRYGIDGSYTKEEVRVEDVRSFLRGLENRRFVGCNVTVPHKDAAYEVADVKDPSALAVEAANTVWIENGEIACANTDTYGFMRHLAASAPLWHLRDAPVAVLGAGGAARAIVYGFLEAGVSEVRVINRSPARAEELQRHFGPRVKTFSIRDFASLTDDVSVLVNSTTLGMSGVNDVEADLGTLRDDCVVADIVYVPLETGLLKRARARNLKTVDGLGMLLHQAVPGFEKWFGVKPEVTTELRALVAADIADAGSEGHS
jgi:shikimate dehydrogenase